MLTHTARAFDADLRALRCLAMEMGGLAERAVADAVDALVTANAGLASRVVASDARIDALQLALEERAVAIIACRQPVAVDLRHVVGTIRIATDIERIGDLAKNVAKRVSATGGVLAGAGEHARRRSLRGFKHMIELALEQFGNALGSFAEADERKALDVCLRDAELDAIYTSLYRELLDLIIGDPAQTSPGVHLLFSAKNLERIGDHATNIAASVCYMKLGRLPGARRPTGGLAEPSRITLPDLAVSA